MAEKAAYRIAELAEMGPLGRSSIYIAIKNGRLVARKLGGATIILKADWERFLNEAPKVA